MAEPWGQEELRRASRAIGDLWAKLANNYEERELSHEQGCWLLMIAALHCGLDAESAIATSGTLRPVDDDPCEPNAWSFRVMIVDYEDPPPA